MNLEWWAYLLYFLGLFVAEFATTTFYNYKIIQISKGKWNIAALNGALATFVWTSFSLFISFFSVEASQLWLIFASVAAVGFGTFWGTYTLAIYPKIRKCFKNWKEQKAN